MEVTKGAIAKLLRGANYRQEGHPELEQSCNALEDIKRDGSPSDGKVYLAAQILLPGVSEYERQLQGCDELKPILKIVKIAHRADMGGCGRVEFFALVSDGKDTMAMMPTRRDPFLRRKILEFCGNEWTGVLKKGVKFRLVCYTTEVCRVLNLDNVWETIPVIRVERIRIVPDFEGLVMTREEKIRHWELFELEDSMQSPTVGYWGWRGDSAHMEM